MMLQFLFLFNLSFVTIAYCATDFDVKEYCKTKKCIKKCCAENEYAMNKLRKCRSYGNSTTINFCMPVYDENIRDTGKKLQDVFMLEPSAFANASFLDNAYPSFYFGSRLYLTESGVLYLESPNNFERWTKETTDRFCVDYWRSKNSSVEPSLVVFIMMDNIYAMPRDNPFLTSGMIISCVFLVLVLVVYLLLPELRNIGGLVLMAYVASLLFAFISLMAIQSKNLNKVGCIAFTMLTYFFLQSSFFWTNVMSLDIWWTFRGCTKSRPIHRRGKSFKFFTYCLYAWGVPLLMAIGLVVLNELNLEHIPWFITPKIPEHGCFLEGGVKLLYLYTPILILIFLNWVFFLMTAFNIWRLSRGTAVLDSAAAGNPASHRTHRHRLLVHLKLSILMGLNWLLEVMSYFKPQLKVWYITDVYNLLIGVAIFLIFVCKKKIFKKLRAKFRSLGNANCKYSMKSHSSRSSGTTDSSNVTQEMPLQVCINPMGSTAQNPILTHTYTPNDKF